MSNDTSMHRHTWDQIPWIVNGSVSETERQVVESHLESCADCREELEFQRRLAIAMENHGTPDIDPRQSWEQLRARIEVAGQPAQAAQEVPVKVQNAVQTADKRRVRGLSGEWTPWLVAAMVVQAIGLGVLGTVLWSKPAAQLASSGAPIYRTLSAAEPAAGAATIRVVFADDMSVGRMKTLLSAVGLQVQSGPTSAGVWSLEPVRESSRSATQDALRELRDSSEVRFAEAIGGSP
jgi:anti-sigma factor RsiW